MFFRLLLGINLIALISISFPIRKDDPALWLVTFFFPTLYCLNFVAYYLKFPPAFGHALLGLKFIILAGFLLITPISGGPYWLAQSYFWILAVAGLHYYLHEETQGLKNPFRLFLNDEEAKRQKLASPYFNYLPLTKILREYRHHQIAKLIKSPAPEKKDLFFKILHPIFLDELNRIKPFPETEIQNLDFFTYLQNEIPPEDLFPSRSGPVEIDSILFRYFQFAVPDRPLFLTKVMQARLKAFITSPKFQVLAQRYLYEKWIKNKKIKT